MKLVLAVLLVFLALPLAYGSVGMGVSDYDAKTTVFLPTIVRVGKVVNTGNETLTFSFVWNQTSSTVNMTLPVSPLENFTLNPGESYEPAINIGQFNESYVGNYTGTVQIKGSYPVQGGGNQAFPGAECHVTLIVTDLPAAPSQKQDVLVPTVLTVACVFAVASTFGIYRELKRGRRKLR